MSRRRNSAEDIVSPNGRTSVLIGSYIGTYLVRIRVSQKKKTLFEVVMLFLFFYLFLIRFRISDVKTCFYGISFRRTCRDSIFLSEVSMNLNLTKNNLKIGFDESPILSVDISGNQMQVFILIVTVTSVHRIVLRHPKVSSVNPDGTPESILANISREQICDASSFYVISNDIGK